jgi:hypothetical protein
MSTRGFLRGRDEYDGKHYEGDNLVHRRPSAKSAKSKPDRSSDPRLAAAP